MLEKVCEPPGFGLVEVTAAQGVSLKGLKIKVQIFFPTKIIDVG